MAESRLYKIAHCNQSVLRRVGQRRDFSREPGTLVLVLPEPLEPIGCQRGVPHGCTRCCGEACGCGQGREAGSVPGTGNHAQIAGHAQRRQAFRHEDVDRPQALRCLTL